MSEACLKFKLPEDKEDFKNAVSGSAMYSYLWELSSWLRNSLKHGGQFKTVNEVLEYLRSDLNEFSNEIGITLP